MHIYICIYRYVCMCVYIHTHIYIHPYICVCLCVCIYIYLCVYTYIYPCLCVCVYICIYIYTCVCVYLCLCVWTEAHVKYGPFGKTILILLQWLVKIIYSKIILFSSCVCVCVSLCIHKNSCRLAYMCMNMWTYASSAHLRHRQANIHVHPFFFRSSCSCNHLIEV